MNHQCWGTRVPMGTPICRNPNILKMIRSSPRAWLRPQGLGRPYLLFECKMVWNLWGTYGHGHSSVCVMYSSAIFLD